MMAAEFPPGRELPPHGDALLRPGKDYELRGNEIVAAPNRTEKLRKLALWECITWYTMALNTEYEKQERKVLDQAIDALADSADAPPSTNSGEVVDELVVGVNDKMEHVLRRDFNEVCDEFEIFPEEYGRGAFLDVLVRVALAAAQKEG